MYQQHIKDNDLDSAIELAIEEMKRKGRNNNSCNYLYYDLIEDNHPDLDEARKTWMLQPFDADRKLLRRGALCERSHVERRFVKKTVKFYIQLKIISNF